MIGEIRIPCAVLEDGRRVLTEHGIRHALLGSRSGASKRLKKAHSEAGAIVPLFLAPERRKPFISLLDRAFPRKGHTIPLLLE